MKPLSEEHLAIFRRHMVETIDIHFDLLADETGRPQLGERLRSALLEVPRHLFVPTELAGAAYQDSPLPLGFDKTISQPFIGALMLDMLDVQDDDAVLEIGSGFGYQSAILSRLSRYVWSIEIVEEFVGIAQERLKALGYRNVALRVGDGTRGWPDAAPFSKILVTAAAPEVPEKLLEQLSPGGRLAMPLGGTEVQQISLVEKHEDGEITTRASIPARFALLETA